MLSKLSPKENAALDGQLSANCFDLRNMPMYSVWVIDFVANEKSLFRAGMTWKKAKRLARKKQREDRFSAWLVVPLDFVL